jgi:hypothetical protein
MWISLTVYRWENCQRGIIKWKHSYPNLRELIEELKIVEYEYKPVENKSSITYLSLEILIQQIHWNEQCSILYTQVLEHQERVYSLTRLIMSQLDKFFSYLNWIRMQPFQILRNQISYLKGCLMSHSNNRTKCLQFPVVLLLAKIPLRKLIIL